MVLEHLATNRRHLLKRTIEAIAPAMQMHYSLFRSATCATCCSPKDTRFTIGRRWARHDYLSWRGSLADGLIALVGTSK